MTRSVGHARTASARSWPVLLALLAAVLVPAGCVVWFMTEAMGNEALAVRQRLRDVYTDKMAAARKRLDWDCQQRFARLTEGQNLPAGQRFALLAAESGADAVLICDQDGQVVYPNDALQLIDAAATDDNPAFRAAAQLEQDGDLAAAAQRYSTLAVVSTDKEQIARALQAQVRCLLQLDNRAEASAALDQLLADEQLREAADASGRLIGPAAQLLRLQLTPDRDTPEFRALADRLRQRLEDYRGRPIPAGQRRFLLHALEEMSPSKEPSAALAAEDLAAEYLQTEQPRAEPGRLTPTRTAGLWHVATPERSVVALYRLDPLLRQWQDLLRRQQSQGMVLRLQPPQSGAGQPEPFLAAAAGEALPGWSLQVHLEGQDPFALATGRKAVYLWTGGAGIALIVALAATVATFVSRQMRLTRLKNDLIATVSHELKTPLSSMRMLVDTLLQGRYRDQAQVREYLQMIDRENRRLSRLIDNFLTFSRMERNKRAFESGPVRVQEVVATAVEAVRERFAAPGCRLEVDVPADLPAVTGDRDALTTVLLNLLDNAHKYTDQDKRVCIRARSEGGHVVLEVSDNGIGIPRRLQRRIFDRFYQVDQTLTRKAPGCGLGLSIVKFILDAHGGTIEVDSTPGAGSRFTIRLPSGERPERP